MATYRHTGVGDATALTDYSSANQVVDNVLQHGGTSAVGTDAYAVNLTISPGAYAAKQRYQFFTDVANTGACTIDFSSIGAKSIKLADGTDPHDGAIQANSVVDVIYDGTNFILLNPYFTGIKSLVTKSELDILDGATVSTAELNVLSGVTATSSEINYNDITTLGTAEASKVVTTDASNNSTGINQLTATTFVGDLTGDVTGNVSGQAGTIASQGALATKSVVGAAEITDGSVGAAELAGGIVGRSKMKVGATSHSGNSASQRVDIALTAYSLWPMIYTGSNVHVDGHSTSVTDPDSPRFSLYATGGSVNTYRVETRFIEV